MEANIHTPCPEKKNLQSEKLEQIKTQFRVRVMPRQCWVVTCYK